MPVLMIKGLQAVFRRIVPSPQILGARESPSHSFKGALVSLLQAHVPVGRDKECMGFPARLQTLAALRLA